MSARPPGRSPLDAASLQSGAPYGESACESPLGRGGERQARLLRVVATIRKWCCSKSRSQRPSTGTRIGARCGRSTGRHAGRSKCESKPRARRLESLSRPPQVGAKISVNARSRGAKLAHPRAPGAAHAPPAEPRCSHAGVPQSVCVNTLDLSREAVDHDPAETCELVVGDWRSPRAGAACGGAPRAWDRGGTPLACTVGSEHGKCERVVAMRAMWATRATRAMRATRATRADAGHAGRCGAEYGRRGAEYGRCWSITTALRESAKWGCGARWGWRARRSRCGSRKWECILLRHEVNNLLL
jgi:hypothetical protein